MSKKHFDKYFQEVASQYSEMLDAVREFEEMSMQQMVSPDRVEQLKKSVEPLKNNFMTLSYVKFLLNMPNRETKHRQYVSSQKKTLKNLDFKRSPSGVVAENKRVLEDIRNC